MLFIKEKVELCVRGKNKAQINFRTKKKINRNSVTVTRAEHIERYLKSAPVAQHPRLSLFHSRLGPNWEENRYDKLLLVLFPNCFGLEINAGAQVVLQSIRRTHKVWEVSVYVSGCVHGRMVRLMM